MGSPILSMRNFARVTKRYFSDENNDWEEEEEESDEKKRENIKIQCKDLSDLFAIENSEHGFDSVCKQYLISTHGLLPKDKRERVLKLLDERSKLCKRFKDLHEEARELSKDDPVQSMVKVVKFFANLSLITPDMLKDWLQGSKDKAKSYLGWAAFVSSPGSFMRSLWKTRNTTSLTKGDKLFKALGGIPKAVSNSVKGFFVFEAWITVLLCATCFFPAMAHLKDQDTIEKCKNHLTRCYLSMLDTLRQISKKEDEIIDMLDFNVYTSTDLIEKLSKDFMRSFYLNVLTKTDDSKDVEFDLQQSKQDRRNKHKSFMDYMNQAFNAYATPRLGRSTR